MSLTPKEWKSFQHYKERRPPWIKLHRTLLDNADFQRLPVASRALAPMLWLIAAEYDGGAITATVDDIAWRLRISVDEFNSALKPLLGRGFFYREQDASKALAQCEQEARPETEAEAETQVQAESDGGGVMTRASSSSMSLISEDAFGITADILKAMGKAADDPMFIGAPYTVQHWLSEGMSRDAIMCGVTTAMARKKHDPPSTFKYFEKAVLRASAELNRPLPKVEVQQPETIKVTANGKQQRGNVLQAADRILDRIRSFDACPDDTDGIRGEPDEATPRLLSQR